MHDIPFLVGNEANDLAQGYSFDSPLLIGNKTVAAKIGFWRGEMFLVTYFEPFETIVLTVLNK